MKRIILEALHTPLTIASTLLLFFVLIIPACQKEVQPSTSEVQSKSSQLQKDFEQVNLVANNDEYNAAHIDSRLINAWGISFSPTSPLWVSAEGTGLSFIFTAT